MQIRMLGTLELVTDDGVVVPVAAPRRRAVLATLATRPNSLVSAGRLLDIVWENDPPPRARTALQVHVSALRKMLTTDVQLETRSGGYVLVCGPDAVDTMRFVALAQRARAAEDDTATVALLRAALDLWRGPALADVSVQELQETVAARLEDERLSVLEELANCLVRLDRAAEIIPDLVAEAESYPLRESLHRALILALYSTGRQAGALTAYDVTRRRLVDTLGVEPGSQLQDLYARILRSEPISQLTESDRVADPVPERVLVRAETAASRPSQLPRNTRGFVGRAEELSWLDKVTSGNPPSHTVALVIGGAGVGKTTLTTYWAHRVADRFQDGQLFIDLHGFDDTDPRSTRTALVSILEELGCDPDEFPEDEDSAAALYRTMVSSRRILLILDNAHSAHQVRQLLPVGPGSVAVVTSRHRLDGLVVHEGAAVLRLESMSRSDSLLLLSEAAGTNPHATNQDAAWRLAELCEDLPLALRIAAAQLSVRPGHLVDELVAELADERQRLAALSTSDTAVSIEASLRSSYRSLSAVAARLFLLSPLFPGDGIDAYAAAALANLSLREGKRALIDLAAVHLADRDAHGRYRCHDLARLYARSLATTMLDASELDQAATRLLDHYITTVGAAKLAVATAAGPRVAPSSPVDWAPRTVLAFESSAAAIGWFSRAEPTVRTLLSMARQRGNLRAVTQLMVNAAPLYVCSGPSPHFVTAATTALDAARASGDGIEIMRAMRSLGVAYTDTQQLAAARAVLREAIELSATLPDEAALDAGTLRIALLRALSRSAPADIDLDDDLVTGVEFPDHPYYAVTGLCALALARLATGQVAGTMALVDKATAAAERVGLSTVRQHLEHARGRVLAAGGDYAAAIRCLTSGVDAAVTIGDIAMQMSCLAALAEVAGQTGDKDTVRSCRDRITALRHGLDAAVANGAA